MLHGALYMFPHTIFRVNLCLQFLSEWPLQGVVEDSVVTVTMILFLLRVTTSHDTEGPALHVGARTHTPYTHIHPHMCAQNTPTPTHMHTHMYTPMHAHMRYTRTGYFKDNATVWCVISLLNSKHMVKYWFFKKIANLYAFCAQNWFDLTFSS